MCRWLPVPFGLALLALPDCFDADIAPGTLGCDSARERPCPSGMVCRDRGGGDWRCYPPNHLIPDLGADAEPSDLPPVDRGLDLHTDAAGDASAPDLARDSGPPDAACVDGCLKDHPPYGCGTAGIVPDCAKCGCPAGDTCVYPGGVHCERTIAAVKSDYTVVNPTTSKVPNKLLLGKVASTLYETFVDFELATKMPAAMTIEKATLRMHQTDYGAPTLNVWFDLAVVNQPWVAPTTTKPATGPVVKAGYSIDSAINPAYHDIIVTEAARQCLGQASCHGFGLLNPQASQTYVGWHATTGTVPPKLIVHYPRK